MFNSKPLNILYNAVTYSNSISSTMNDARVYEYLRTYHFPLIKASHITIRKSSGKLAQVSYDTLKAALYTPSPHLPSASKAQYQPRLLRSALRRTWPLYARIGDYNMPETSFR
jgi:lambda repressor-like predicted transcriptional regulator